MKIGILKQEKFTFSSILDLKELIFLFQPFFKGILVNSDFFLMVYPVITD